MATCRSTRILAFSFRLFSEHSPDGGGFEQKPQKLALAGQPPGQSRAMLARLRQGWDLTHSFRSSLCSRAAPHTTLQGVSILTREKMWLPVRTSVR
jgi:hypothetical protein